jgi:cytochrome c peroxidase
MLDEMRALPGNLVPVPAALQPAAEEEGKIELGKMLFFDKRLSLDNSISCATCHDPAKAFTDGRRRAIGAGAKELPRNSPTVLNAAYNTSLFWDGRAPDLETQAAMPIRSVAEMNMGAEEELDRRLSIVPDYDRRFRNVFGQGPTMKNVAAAIAAFERTLSTPGSRFDEYLAGDKHALTSREKQGLILFIGKASCSQCHNGVNLTDDKFYNLGAPKNKGEQDLGRFAVTHDDKDREAFKTPSLRNVALTAPYLHDGSMKTLEEVVDYYDEGCGGPTLNKSDLIYKLNLTPDEKRCLVAFLKTLTGKIPTVSIPNIPQENPHPR